MKKILIFSIILVLSANSLWAQDAQHILENVLLQQKEDANLTESDITFQVTSHHVSAVSGIHHIYYRQTVNGIPILGTESDLHVKDDKTFKHFNGFVPDVQQLAEYEKPSVSAKNAIQRAALSEHYSTTKDFLLVRSDAVKKSYVYSDGGISLSEIPVSLVYIRNGDTVQLAWDLAIQEKNQEHWYNIRVNAITGNVISKYDWMTQCNLEHSHKYDDHLDYNRNLMDVTNEYKTTATILDCTECYEVFALPLESPYYGTRTIETNIANDASPFGWHDIDGTDGADFTTTRGNNVNAYEDGDNLGYQPDGGQQLDFSGYAFDQDYSIDNQFEDAAITNLFYWNNIIHNLMFQYGFDSVAGNFQENNYGQDGEESDSVNAEAQDGAGECNANFGTPPDGINPRMQMFTCGDKDGDFDNLVIIHEYGHGISNRLTGGGANVSCLYGNEQMGEGWSDYYGVMLTMTESDMEEDARTVGTYLFDRGIDGEGIRAFPYSTDLAVNPQTYDDIKEATVPHGVGSVWATMLWEMTWNLIKTHGFSEDFSTVTGDINLDAGNVQALLLVTEALKLQPCAPGFIDGRDAILAADVAIYDGANACVIWDAFAKRGLGFSAVQGNSASRLDGTEAFDRPSIFATFTAPPAMCQSGLVITEATGGFPFGGTYSGPGVTDNGNGYSYTFDPSTAGPGIHTIVYQVPSGVCSIASANSDTIEVFTAPEGPTTTDALLVCLNEEVTVVANLNDFTNVINWYDEPEGGNLLGTGTSLTFIPQEGRTVYAQEGPLLPQGELKITEITLLAPDGFEITNVGGAKDYTGYKIALSDIPFNNINTVNEEIRELGFMAENSVVHFDDLSQSPNYWGANISWFDGGHGWIVIIDPDNNVVDSVFWNANETQINEFVIDIDGTSITAADLDWSGAGANFSEFCDASFRRIGEDDNASNWSSNCLVSDFGTLNNDLGFGLQSCLAQRTPSLITGEEEFPTITCPDGMVITQSAADFILPDFTTQAIATDNCSFVISQSPMPGTLLPTGSYTITLTATDTTGNAVTCNFVLDAILGVDETILDQNLSLIPNPTFGNIELDYNGDAALTMVQVFDVNGRLIKEINPSNTGITNFSIAEVANGVYFVRILAGNNLTVKRVIKK